MPALPHDPIQRALEVERQLRRAQNAPAIQQELPVAADLSRVPFPDRNLALPKRVRALYGFKHHSNVSKLALRAAEDLTDAPGGFGGAPLSLRALNTIRAVGSLHDLGRTAAWPDPDAGHQIRSADLADRVMREDQAHWGDAALREDVTRLIAVHCLVGAPPQDPRLIALWDAELFESMRLDVGTREGARAISAAMSRVVTPWARRVEHQLRWRDTYWK